jgi:hypothetical protein
MVVHLVRHVRVVPAGTEAVQPTPLSSHVLFKRVVPPNSARLQSSLPSHACLRRTGHAPVQCVRFPPVFC